jgi:hypothetical protein
MRALLLLAVTALAALVWPRGENSVRGARAVAEPAPATVARLPLPREQAKAAAGPQTAEAPAPPRGVEQGPCALHLNLVTHPGDQAFESWVELWRLGVPETSVWTAGDRLQAIAMVDDDGHVFAGLPPGRYRVVVYDQRADVADAPPFDVDGDRTDKTLFVVRPRWYSVRLRVVTETGEGITSAGLIRDAEEATHWRATPDWASPRRLKKGGSIEGAAARWTCTTLEHDHWGADSADGIFEFRFREDGRRTRWHRCITFESHRRTKVIVPLTGEHPVDRDYVGVAVSWKKLDSFVLMPDGRPAADVGAESIAVSVAVPAGQPWQSIPVRVLVKLDGYEALNFTYCVDRPPAPQVMRPKTPGAACDATENCIRTR